MRDCSGSTGIRYLYPVYGNKAGETIDFYYNQNRRCWNMRHQVCGQTVHVRMFERGHSWHADFTAACNHLAREAKRRGMTFLHRETRI
ncbi:MAG: hypothetical protein ACOYI6_04325 [Christensenellales bacterium]